MRRWIYGGLGVLAAASLLAAVVATTAGAGSRTLPRKVFYLDLKPGNCARPVSGTKKFLVVSCSDGRHSYEVFALGHGGWGRGTVPTHANALAVGTHLCQTNFQRRFGHPILTGYGSWVFWPDRGAEQAKYGDRMVCSLVRWPKQVAMGPGTHFR